MLRMYPLRGLVEKASYQETKDSLFILIFDLGFLLIIIKLFIAVINLAIQELSVASSQACHRKRRKQIFQINVT